MTIVMLIAIRSPLGAALAAGLAMAAAAFALSALGGDGVRDGEGDRKVREIRASSAPLLASDLAGFRERRRREGSGDVPLLTAWLAQYPTDDRRGMRDWLDYHAVRTGSLAGGFYVETSTGPGTDGWFRIEVDRAARRVELTCGGRPAPGCSGGRWRLHDFGLTRSYLLGANDEH
jgi:hypothetical protein